MKSLIIVMIFLFLTGFPTEAQTALEPVEVARYGRGVLGDRRAWSPDGATLAVIGSRGIWFYDTINPAPPDFLAMGGQVRLAYAPDGRLLAGSNSDGVVTILDTERQPIQTFSAKAAAWSSDGALLALDLGDSLVILDTQTWEERDQLAASALTGFARSNWSHEINFSPDGRFVMFKYIDDDEAWWDNVAVWDLETRAVASIGDYFDNDDLTKMDVLAVSPDGVTIALLKGGGNINEDEIRLLNTETGETVLRETGALLGEAAFSPDGQTLAVANNPYQVALWDMATWERLNLIDDEGQPAFSPDGERLALNGGIISLEVLAPLQTDEVFKERFIASPAGNVLLRWSNDLSLIDPVTGETTAILEGVESPLAHAEFSPDGRWLMTAHENLKLYQWEVSTGRMQIEIVTIKAVIRGPTQRKPWEPETFDIYWHFAFSPDGAVVVVKNNGEDDEKRQIIWSLNEQGRLQLHPRYRLIPFEPYTAQGELVLQSEDNTLSLWQPLTGQPRLIARLDERELFLGLNADSTRLAYHSYNDNEITVLTTDVENPIELARIPVRADALGIGGAHFSPDDRYFFYSVTISEILPQENYVWDMVIGEPVNPEDFPTELVFEVTSERLGVVRDPAGSKFYIYSIDATIDDPPLAEIDARGGRPIFTPDGAHLIVVYSDGVVVVWGL